MATERPKRIHLGSSAACRFEERTAAGTIKPGHLIGINSSGNAIAHDAAGGRAAKEFALEDALQGKTINDNYASGDRVFTVIAAPGDIVYAWLSGGEHATPNEFLTSNGDGALKVVTGTDHAIAQAVEEVNASDSNDVDERIKVRIL